MRSAGKVRKKPKPPSSKLPGQSPPCAPAPPRETPSLPVHHRNGMLLTPSRRERRGSPSRLCGFAAFPSLSVRQASLALRGLRAQSVRHSRSQPKTTFAARNAKRRKKRSPTPVPLFASSFDFCGNSLFAALQRCFRCVSVKGTTGISRQASKPQRDAICR